MLNISKAEKRYSEIELDLHKKLAYENGRASIVAELEKIKEEIKEYGSIWVQYSIKGHTDKDIDDIVDDVLKQAKQSFIRRLDKHISKLKGVNNA